MTIYEIIEHLHLSPHPEGGYYREVYRSKGIVPHAALKNAFDGDRNYCTSIYFLLTSDNFSAFHRLKQDEVWHFYAGSPLYIHVINPDGTYQRNELGLDLTTGIAPQFVVPAGRWFASSVKEPNSFSLVGCTVAPGFDFADFEMADRNELMVEYPQHSQIITELTR